MKHLVGTLVRYKSGGDFVPYLAEEWAAEATGLQWKFKIREGLFCEDGEAINALSLKRSFERIIPIYKQKSALPYLDQLLGLDSAKKSGDSISGIVADGAYLTFQFSSPVLSGFLEYLSMPYYGYFCENNFSADGWKSNQEITSSGPYALADYQLNQKNISKLKMRNDWILLNAKAEGPEEVYLHWGEIDKQDIGTEKTIIQSIEGKVPNFGEFQKVLGAPDILYSVILDINSKSPFQIKKNRTSFKSKFRELQKNYAFDGVISTLTNTVFIDQSNLLLIEDAEEIRYEGLPIEVLSLQSQSIEIAYIEKIVKQTLDILKIPYVFRRIGQDHNLKTVDKTSRTKFSIRIASVFSGATYDSWVTDMMFCSDMGISFPDPSGRICNTVKKALKGDDKGTRKDIGNRIAAIVEDDASVIPVLHVRNAFFISKDLNLDQIAPDTIVLSFEDQKIK